MTLLLLSFVAGILTVLAPCVLPLLPVIVGGSIEGGVNKKKALTVVTSLGISVVAFTLLLKASTIFIHIPEIFWMWFSGGILILYGLVTLFPKLWDLVPYVNKIQQDSNMLVSRGYQKGSIAGDILIGAALGPVFASCSPTYFLILATVLPVSPATGVVYLVAYAIGMCGALFAIAFAGQRILERLDIAADQNGVFKRGLGALILLVGLAILFGIDKKIELAIFSSAGVFDITRVEQYLLQKREPAKYSQSGGLVVLDEKMRIAQKEQRYQRAPEIVHPSGFVNTGGKSLTIGEFKGKKVVLLDIWTYSCINCQRTLPYIKAWDDKYRDQGLQIIGIHTPEFAFEHVQSNVEDAIKKFGLKYPTVLDNEYGTWNVFGNSYWPRKYLVDIDGYIVYDHAGEGNYDVTEKAIQDALAERAIVLGDAKPDMSNVASTMPEPDLSGINSPETYFGATRDEYFGNGTFGLTGEHSFTLPGTFSLNTFYFAGTWNTAPEYAETKGPAKIVYKYNSKDVYLVASADSPVKITVFRDGKPIGNFGGADIDAKTSTGTIKENRLYKIAHDSEPGEHLLEIDIQGAGLKAYTFTFG